MAIKAESKPLRIGTLGASRIAPAALINPARKNDGAEVVAVAARDRSRAEKYARKYDIPWLGWRAQYAGYRRYLPRGGDGSTGRRVAGVT